MWVEVKGVVLIRVMHSPMQERKLRQHPRLLPPSPDPQRRRAHDDLLQVRQVQYGLAGELRTRIGTTSEMERRSMLDYSPSPPGDDAWTGWRQHCEGPEGHNQEFAECFDFRLRCQHSDRR